MDTIITAPLEFDVQCHSQVTEHGIALTTDSVWPWKCKNHESQLGVAFSTDVVRKNTTVKSRINHMVNSFTMISIVCVFVS